MCVDCFGILRFGVDSKFISIKIKMSLNLILLLLEKCSNEFAMNSESYRIWNVNSSFRLLEELT